MRRLPSAGLYKNGVDKGMLKSKLPGLVKFTGTIPEKTGVNVPLTGNGPLPRVAIHGHTRTRRSGPSRSR